MTQSNNKINFRTFTREELLHILEDLTDHTSITTNLLVAVRLQRKTELRCWECESLIHKLGLENQI